MNKENIPVITDREKLYDKCENMEQLFDKYYLPLLDKHYSKTYELQQENMQLKKQLLVAQTNEETFRLEMKDITQTLGLAEDTLFDDVKVYAKSLKDNWNKLKEHLKNRYDNGTESISYRQVFMEIREAMQVLEIAQELEKRK